jgi:hypothetical protein
VLGVQAIPALLRQVSSVAGESTGDGLGGVVIAEAGLVLVRVIGDFLVGPGADMHRSERLGVGVGVGIGVCVCVDVGERGVRECKVEGERAMVGWLDYWCAGYSER